MYACMHACMHACLLVVAGSRSCCGAVQLRYGVEAGSRFLHPTHFQAHHRHVWYTDELGSVEFIHYAPLVFQQAIDHPATSAPGLGFGPATSAPGLGLTPATSASGLGFGH
jgi:hypothetical protein